MSEKIYTGPANIITPLGFSTDGNFNKLLSGESAISRHENSWMPHPYFASVIDEVLLDKAFADVSADANFTKLEKMMILALQPAVAQSGSGLNKKTAFILSTTKGNITALEQHDVEKATLHQLAKTIAGFFKFQSEPIVISNACVSGIMAMSVAKRLMQSGMYDDAFVVAGDLVSEFVLSGFNSFQAMSDAPCKPYSKNRTGVTLGEAAAAVYLTKEKTKASAEILGDGSINDANHISGPSRTGEGLFLSVESALKEANISSEKIGFISAHGTATPFNDEMEAIAFNRLSLGQIPLHSLKGYYGHTLGASGLLEAVIGIEAMNRGKLIASAGFDEIGVSENINVIAQNADADIDYFLKTASGFGGCNTAVVFGKVI
ncbi:beta-ketoacyl synthase N-terminal-like domain-containing protein [Flavobacterium silvaticum]|uniref:Beta-ketoacyl synthase n=1 Tax=Flavobacterium silvaticum TaxID=1852020 RepID=A0A972FZK9_9FLAO|nr:beta-ketoacyl synthase N-terminal-like domain-containing protein [Flavobacterium silvaticum]NMH27696.1 beta-ketoacyl synthase [Flavobacterium silvaticum]